MISFWLVVFIVGNSSGAPSGSGAGAGMHIGTYSSWEECRHAEEGAAGSVMTTNGGFGGMSFACVQANDKRSKPPHG